MDVLGQVYSLWLNNIMILLASLQGNFVFHSGPESSQVAQAFWDTSVELGNVKQVERGQNVA